MNSGKNTDSKHLQIRNEIRQYRCALDEHKQELAATRLFQTVTQDPDYDSADTLAFYLAFDGEINPAAILQQALKTGKSCCLPVLDVSSLSLFFVEYQLDSVLHRNKFGIEEPSLASAKILSPEQIDVIFVPLVAFDEAGTRLGMGQGYYDRTLAAFGQKDSQKAGKTTKLIGLAHEFQRVERLERAEWDIPLDKIITDQNTYKLTT